MNSIDIDVIRTALDWQSRGHRVVMGTVVRGHVAMWENELGCQAAGEPLRFAGCL